MEDMEARKPLKLPGRLSPQDPLGTSETQSEAGRQLALPASMGLRRHVAGPSSAVESGPVDQLLYVAVECQVLNQPDIEVLRITKIGPIPV